MGRTFRRLLIFIAFTLGVTFGCGQGRSVTLDGDEHAQVQTVLEDYATLRSQALVAGNSEARIEALKAELLTLPVSPQFAQEVERAIGQLEAERDLQDEYSFRYLAAESSVDITGVESIGDNQIKVLFDETIMHLVDVANATEAQGFDPDQPRRSGGEWPFEAIFNSTDAGLVLVDVKPLIVDPFPTPMPVAWPRSDQQLQSIEDFYTFCEDHPRSPVSTANHSNAPDDTTPICSDE